MSTTVVISCPGCGRHNCGAWSDCMKIQKVAPSTSKHKFTQCERLEKKLRILLSPIRSIATDVKIEDKLQVVLEKHEDLKKMEHGYLKISLSQKNESGVLTESMDKCLNAGCVVKENEEIKKVEERNLRGNNKLAARDANNDDGEIQKYCEEDISLPETLRIKVECCGKMQDEVFCCFDRTDKVEQSSTQVESRSSDSVLMKLNLVVLETGQQWKRAFVRMVLDPGKVDYGTLSVAVPGSTDGMMAQDNIYQRQPLLPNQNSSLVLTIEDSDEDADGLHSMQPLPRNQNGRVVNIKLPPPLKEEPRFPKEIFKTFVAFTLMAFSMTLGILVLSIVHDSVPNLDIADRNVSKPLPDFILDHLPINDTWALNASEIIIMISFYSCFIVIFLHKYRFIVARRVLLIMGLLYLMRCLTMFVTVLPVSSYTYKCSPREPHPSFLLYLQRTWHLLTGFGLSIYGKHTYCGDFIFSGHTTILVMAYLVISEYSPRKLYPLHWVSWCLSIFGVICVLLSRGHYTIDVVIAYYVTTRTFWIYHTLVANPKLKEWSNNNYLSRVWWFPVFRYFEGNILAPVPRQYDWPLPWPRRFLSRRTNRDS